jgi:hypothetical protein
MEDSELWGPLARRWLGEIQRCAAAQSNRPPSVSTLEDNTFIPYHDTRSVFSTPSLTTATYTPATSPSYDKPSGPRYSSISATSSTPVASSSSHRDSFPGSSNATVNSWLLRFGIPSSAITRLSGGGWISVYATVLKAEELLQTEYYIHESLRSIERQVGCQSYRVPFWCTTASISSSQLSISMDQ